VVLFFIFFLPLRSLDWPAPLGWRRHGCSIFLRRPYTRVAVNSFPHMGQMTLLLVFFQLAGFGCR
jgi:hypothetical protein